MSKLKIWDRQGSWETAEEEWQRGAEAAAKEKKLKSLKCLPNMQGITPETARFLKWKSLYWMVTRDHRRAVMKGFLRHPMKYGWALLRSALKSAPYHREGDFFYYGIDGVGAFEKLLQRKDTLFVLGFSYCHKPFECPSGRFNDQCIHDPENPVCRQCFIGKALHAVPAKDTLPLIIPTVHYIGEKIFDAVHLNPEKEVIFLITACEMTLKMFGDWGNMVGIKGIGVRLDGRICNTMKAFALSEEGIKPGLTVVLNDTQKRMIDLIRVRRESRLQHKATDRPSS
ncbi:MAG: hypothetical protein H7A37_01350 [Chlamydiales bacterium]|nr:hypothetical protein [Chlamydiia bacterium]MCP5506940.1 hypothetical protein [Chlamydiales bacterium]